jgi:hypothetical protein
MQSGDSTPENLSVELTPAQFVALAESDRDAALKLMWPDGSDAESMRLLDAIAFDGYIKTLKAQIQAESEQAQAAPHHYYSD